MLNAILATEITPELVPTNEGETPQSTEAHIGPYALQDFNLYYTLRHGMVPSKIAFLALHARAMWRKATGRRVFPPIGVAATTLRRSANGWRCSCAGSLRSAN